MARFETPKAFVVTASPLAAVRSTRVVYTSV